jgi:hypothetical protein
MPTNKGGICPGHGRLTPCMPRWRIPAPTGSVASRTAAMSKQPGLASRQPARPATGRPAAEDRSFSSSSGPGFCGRGRSRAHPHRHRRLDLAHRQGLSIGHLVRRRRPAAGGAPGPSGGVTHRRRSAASTAPVTRLASPLPCAAERRVPTAVPALARGPVAEELLVQGPPGTAGLLSRRQPEPGTSPGSVPRQRA